MNMESAKGNCSISQKLIFAFVILLQIIVICHWASKRSNYFVDELFSFGYAHSYTFDRKDIYYIDNSPEWKYEEWVSNEKLKTQLEVSKEESLLNKDFVTALKMLLTRRNFHALLNITMDVFSDGKPSMWPPIILNIVFFVFSQVLLFQIIFEMSHSFSVSLLAAFMYGFSGTAINTHLYIRFYALVTLLILGCIRIHQKMWKERRILYFSIESICGMLLLYFALKNSELIMIMGGAIVMAFTLSLLFSRRYREAFLYMILIIPASLLFLIKKTNLINVVLHPEAYQGKGGATGWITENFMTVNTDKIVSLFFKYLRWFSDQMFGSWYVLCSFLILISILLEIKLLGEKKERKQSECVPEKESDIQAVRFVWVIFGASAVYYIFALLTGLMHLRYFSFYFPMVIILLWTIIGVLTKELKYRKQVLTGCFILLCIGGSALQIIRPEALENIYADDQSLINAVHDTDIQCAVVISSEKESANHSIYDCIHILPYSAKLYPVNLENDHIDITTCPDQLLVWSNNAVSTDDYTKDLQEAGYTFETLGSTHASVVYIAEKS